MLQSRLVRCIIAALLVIALFSGIRSCTSYRYDGLDSEQSIPANPFDNSKYYYENGLRYYRDGTYTSRVGIDVSSHQGQINWNAVSKTGVKFAMIRVGYRGSTEGNIYEDARFEENITGAKKAGMKVGVYFFSMAQDTDEALEEAKFVTKKLSGHEVDYPVTFDLEVSESQHQGSLTVKQATRITDAFCKYVAKKGYQPMVYGNPTWLENHVDLTYLTDYPIWLAHYTANTNFPYRYRMWQYSDSGTLNGIGKKVDMDILLIRK